MERGVEATIVDGADKKVVHPVSGKTQIYGNVAAGCCGAKERQTERRAERGLVPHLTRFTGLCCEGPGRHHCSQKPAIQE